MYLSADADSNPARKTRKRVLTSCQKKQQEKENVESKRKLLGKVEPPGLKKAGKKVSNE